MKRLALPLLAALALAGCSNSADGVNFVPVVPALPTQETPQETPAVQQQEETWPQVTAVDFNVDLDGFEVAPYDPADYGKETYQMDWVFVSKTDWDDITQNNTKCFTGNKPFRLKPIEFHKSNPNGLTFLCEGTLSNGNQNLPSEGAYRCKVYRKKNMTSNDMEKFQGCHCVWKPTGERFKTEWMRVYSKTFIEVGNGERFRELYKYTW